MPPPATIGITNSATSILNHVATAPICCPLLYTPLPFLSIIPTKFFSTNSHSAHQFRFTVAITDGRQPEGFRRALFFGKESALFVGDGESGKLHGLQHFQPEGAALRQIIGTQQIAGMMCHNNRNTAEQAALLPVG